MLEKIKKYLREYFVIQLYRLWGKLQLWQFKRGSRLVELVRFNIRMGVRISDTSAKQEGFDEEKDLHLHVASMKIMHPEYFDEEIFARRGSDPFEGFYEIAEKLRLDYEAHKAEIDGIIENALKLKFVMKWLEQYLLGQCYLCEFGYRNKGEREYWENRLKEISKAPVFLEHRDIEKGISEAKKASKTARFELSDREALKINLDLNSVGSLIGILSTLALVAGFTHSFFYYKYFGIKVSEYFTVSDYISSSIESLYVLFISVMVSMVVMFLGVHRASRKPIAQIEYEQSKPDYFVFTVTGILLLSLISGLFLGGKALHSGISIAILFAGFLFVPNFVRKYFNNYLISLLSVMVIVTFTSRLYSKIYDDIYDVLEDRNTQIACENVEFDANVKLGADPCKMVILGGTSDYMFLYDKPNERTYVVPRSHLVLGTHKADSSRANVFDMLSNWVRDYVEKDD